MGLDLAGSSGARGLKQRTIGRNCGGKGSCTAQSPLPITASRSLSTAEPADTNAKPRAPPITFIHLLFSFSLHSDQHHACSTDDMWSQLPLLSAICHLHTCTCTYHGGVQRQRLVSLSTTPSFRLYAGAISLLISCLPP